MAVSQIIMDYILRQKMIEVPAVQNKFSLSYREMKTIIDELIEDEKLKFLSGVAYSVKESKDKSDKKSEKDLVEELCRKRIELLTENPKKNKECFEEDKDEVIYDKHYGVMEKAKIDKRDKGSETPMERMFNAIYPSNEAEEDDDDYWDVTAVDKMEAVLFDGITNQIRWNSEDNEFIARLENMTYFAFQFDFDKKTLKIHDKGDTARRAEASIRRIENVLKQYPNVTFEKSPYLDLNVISVTIINPNAILEALMILYAAVDAVKKLK